MFIKVSEIEIEILKNQVVILNALIRINEMPNIAIKELRERVIETESIIYK